MLLCAIKKRGMLQNLILVETQISSVPADSTCTTSLNQVSVMYFKKCSVLIPLENTEHLGKLGHANFPLV